MDHSAHMTSMPDHDMPDMPAMCSMNMLFTWDWHNTCVVFRWWHIRSLFDFLVSFIAIVLISAGYEFIRYWINKWESSYQNLVSGSTVNSSASTLQRYRVKKSVFYGLQVGYSFMLMLVFMTYNGWLMIAVVIGAILGKHFWGVDEQRSMACH